MKVTIKILIYLLSLSIISCSNESNNQDPEATVTQEISQTSDVLESGNKMNSPMVGTFYSAPNPESEPFVKVGDQINEGDVLCIIEAMKMMNEVKSEFSGTVKQILVDNAEPVEFDQTLFVIS